MQVVPGKAYRQGQQTDKAYCWLGCLGRAKATQARYDKQQVQAQPEIDQARTPFLGKFTQKASVDPVTPELSESIW